MRKVILHIPHSSIIIPFTEGFVVSKEELTKEILKLTDWYTDDLFSHDNAEMVIAPFSRIFCDVERFPNDKDEVMAKFGMGMLYTNFDDGRSLRTVNPGLRNKIHKEFYSIHHNQFLKLVDEELNSSGKCLIIDCHSFSSIPFERDINKVLPRPDINIGSDSYHTPKALLNIATQYFKGLGLSCKVNAPYSGAIVPLEYYLKNKSVQSIMVEINRDLYLTKNSNRKSENYKEIKNIINGFIETMTNT